MIWIQLLFLSSIMRERYTLYEKIDFAETATSLRRSLAMLS